MTLSTHDRCLFLAFKSNRSFLPRLSNLVTFLVLPNFLSRDSWLSEGCDFWLVHDFEKIFKHYKWCICIPVTSIIFRSYWLKIGNSVCWRISQSPMVWSMTPVLPCYKVKASHTPQEVERSNPLQCPQPRIIGYQINTQKHDTETLQNKHKRS